MDIIDKINLVIESSVVGGGYIAGTSNIAGSGQTRAWGSNVDTEMIDLNRKEPVEDERDDPAETNILGRKGLKFDKNSGAYVPELWEE